LGDQLTEAERGGAGRIHVDVMDERFVPNPQHQQPTLRVITITAGSASICCYPVAVTVRLGIILAPLRVRFVVANTSSAPNDVVARYSARCETPF
jgi:hypothetical protein